MKAFNKTLAVVGLTFGLVGMASASPEFYPADDTLTSKVCVAAVSGSKHKLADSMKDANVGKRFVVEQVTCNGMPFVEFVAQYGENSDAINKYITSGKYANNEFIASTSN